MTKVQLTKPHTHAGIAYAPDDVIEVNEREKRFLAEHDVIQPGNKKGRWLRSVPTTSDDEESQK